MTAVAALPTLKPASNPALPTQIASRPSLRALQLGMSWFAEKPGGLDRYFSELLEHLPEAGVAGRGIVMGSERVSQESNGNIVAAAAPNARLWTRWSAMRKCVSAEMADTHFDLIASHHSLYTAPVLPMIKGTPLVVHFHGPYAAESSAENSRFLHNAAKHVMERSGIKGADLGCFIPHQANKRIILSTAERLGLSLERVIINIDRYGNTTAATIPLAMQTAREEGRLKKEDLVLIASVGAGFTAGASLLRWEI